MARELAPAGGEAAPKQAGPVPRKTTSTGLRQMRHPAGAISGHGSHLQIERGRIQVCNVLPPSRASSLPQGICVNAMPMNNWEKTVGASLLAMTAAPSTSPGQTRPLLQTARSHRGMSPPRRNITQCITQLSRTNTPLPRIKRQRHSQRRPATPGQVARRLEPALQPGIASLGGG